MEYIGGVSSLYIRKFARKLDQYNVPMPLPDYFGPMIENKKKVRIAEVGAGPINTIGNYWLPEVEVEVVASDVLQPEYEKLWREHGATPVVPVEYQDMEALTYPDEAFDIIHAVNCLDHTKDAQRALAELLRVCKRGGWVYLRHAPDQMKRFGGHHFWNAKFIPGDPAVCEFHGKDSAFQLNYRTGWKVHMEGDLIVALWQKPI